MKRMSIIVITTFIIMNVLTSLMSMPIGSKSNHTTIMILIARTTTQVIHIKSAYPEFRK